MAVPYCKEISKDLARILAHDVELNYSQYLNILFDRFVLENGITSYDEIEVINRTEHVKTDDGSISIRVTQELRKKQPKRKK